MSDTIFASGVRTGSSPMQLKFVRSGGIAGRATNVEGTITFGPDGAHVTANSGKYARELSSEEEDEIRTAAEPARLQAALRCAKPNRTRDAYQYQIAILTADCEAETVTLAPDPGGELQKIFEWVRHETDRIWAHRIANR